MKRGEECQRERERERERIEVERTGGEIKMDCSHSLL